MKSGGQQPPPSSGSEQQIPTSQPTHTSLNCRECNKRHPGNWQDPVGWAVWSQPGRPGSRDLSECPLRKQRQKPGTGCPVILAGTTEIRGVAARPHALLLALLTSGLQAWPEDHDSRVHGTHHQTGGKWRRGLETSEANELKRKAVS